MLPTLRLNTATRGLDMMSKSNHILDLTSLESLESKEAEDVSRAVSKFINAYGASDAWFMIHTIAVFLLRGDDQVWKDGEFSSLVTPLDPYPIEVEYRSTNV